MYAGATGSGRVRVDRFHAYYHISSEHPSPERIRDRLDDAARKRVPESLAEMLRSWDASGDPSLWLIRRLELKVDVNMAWDRDQLGQRWAARIARYLTKTLEGEGDGQNVLRFPDRATYLARFLSDLASGNAWGQWYYESFEGLRLLPTSAALRTAICDNPADGLAALQQLSRPELKKALLALSIQDARRILDTFSASAAAGDETRCFYAAWSAWSIGEWESAERGDEWRNALRLYLEASRDHESAGGLPLRAAVLALLRLARHLGSDSARHGEQLLQALLNGDLANLYTTAGASDAEVLTAFFRCPPAWVQEVGRAMLAQRAGQVTARNASPSGSRHTSLGGIFLLLPLLDELPLEAATCGWPDAEGTTAAALARFLLLVKCCGRSRAHNVFHDPLVRDVLGIAPTVSSTLLAEWQSRLTPAYLQTFMETIARWQREGGVVRDQKLILAAIPARGRPIALLLDCQRGAWLFAGGYDPARPERLIERLRPTLPVGGEENILLSDEVFLASLRSAFPTLSVQALRASTTGQMTSEDSALAEVLARLDRLPEDLNYLSLPPMFRAPRRVDLALSVAAQGLMRAFAWRLPGFARSGLAYLYTNFLDIAGSMEEEAGRRVVRVGRPPLNLVLNMTGMARSAYPLSWLDERPFVLFQEG